MMRALAMSFAVLAVFGTKPARADDLKGVWFAGGTLNDGRSAYAGAVLALPGRRLGEGLAIRGSASGGSYDYVKGIQPFHGTYVGGEIALVCQWSGRWGWANASVGARVTDTRLDPADPANGLRGTRADLALQFDGALDGSRWRMGWYGSLGAIDRTFQARVEAGRKLAGGRRRVGFEAGVLGDPAYTRTSAGAFLATPLAGNIEFRIGAGADFQHGRSPGAYAAIALSSVF